ncbi:hypothetical protein Btru_045737 [Bulinus truncatus]|nr:hypothetical protein Btru_045737 [Bulinus truncatus]
MSGTYRVNTVLPNCFDTIGEAPHWDVGSQSLYCVDIHSGGLLRWDASTNTVDKAKLNGKIGFAIPRESGGLTIGLNRSIASFHFDQQELVTLAEVDPGTENRLNDGKCDTTGRLWAGTLGPSLAPGVIQMGCGTLYSFSRDHTISSHLTKLDISNGMDWSNDNSVMYFIDSMTFSVMAFDFDITLGSIRNKKTVAEFQDKTCVPDGMCVDSDGKLWVAFYKGSRVCRIDPETGDTLLTINFPVTNVTSCCFGGKHLDELYVTSSAYNIPQEEITHKQPLAGSLFQVTGLGVKGRVSNNFQG